MVFVVFARWWCDRDGAEQVSAGLLAHYRRQGTAADRSHGQGARDHPPTTVRQRGFWRHEHSQQTTSKTRFRYETSFSLTRKFPRTWSISKPLGLVIVVLVFCKDFFLGGGSCDSGRSHSRRCRKHPQTPLPHVTQKLLVRWSRDYSSLGGHAPSLFAPERNFSSLRLSGGTWYGVDIVNEDIADNFEACVWEPSVVKINALTAASEAACLILSVDETIKNPKAAQDAGPAPGRGRGRGRPMWTVDFNTNRKYEWMLVEILRELWIFLCKQVALCFHKNIVLINVKMLWQQIGAYSSRNMPRTRPECLFVSKKFICVHMLWVIHFHVSIFKDENTQETNGMKSVLKIRIESILRCQVSDFTTKTEFQPPAQISRTEALVKKVNSVGWSRKTVSPRPSCPWVFHPKQNTRPHSGNNSKCASFIVEI